MHCMYKSNMPSSCLTTRPADNPGIGLDLNKLKRARLRADLTQEEAAARSGLRSRQVWNNIERGRDTNITLRTLDRIAAALGVRARDLLR